jgi:ATP-binding cassette subfamily F protein uup
LPALIDQLEIRLAELTRQISGSEFYKQDQEVIAKTLDELKQTEEKLELAFKRWDQLEAQRA